MTEVGDLGGPGLTWLMKQLPGARQFVGLDVS